MTARIDHPFCSYCVEALRDQLRIESACIAMMRIAGWMYAELLADEFAWCTAHDPKWCPDRERALAQVMREGLFGLSFRP